MESCYTINESFNFAPTNANFQLHNHNDYEILLFLEGDARYIVEDNIYTLEPGDLILIRKHEFHRIYHNSPFPGKCLCRLRSAVSGGSHRHRSQNHR